MSVVIPSSVPCGSVLVTFEKRSNIYKLLLQQDETTVELNFADTKIVSKHLGEDYKVYDTWDGPGAPSIHTWIEREDGWETGKPDVAIGMDPKEPFIIIEKQHVEHVKDLFQGFLRIWGADSYLSNIPRSCQHLCEKHQDMKAK